MDGVNMRWYVAFLTGQNHRYGYYGPYDSKAEAETKVAKLVVWGVKHLVVQCEETPEIKKLVWAK